MMQRDQKENPASSWDSKPGIPVRREHADRAVQGEHSVTLRYTAARWNSRNRVVGVALVLKGTRGDFCPADDLACRGGLSYARSALNSSETNTFQCRGSFPTDPLTPIAFQQSSVRERPDKHVPTLSSQPTPHSRDRMSRQCCGNCPGTRPREQCRMPFEKGNSRTKEIRGMRGISWPRGTGVLLEYYWSMPQRCKIEPLKSGIDMTCHENENRPLFVTLAP